MSPELIHLSDSYILLFYSSMLNIRKLCFNIYPYIIKYYFLFTLD